MGVPNLAGISWAWLALTSPSEDGHQHYFERQHTHMQGMKFSVNPAFGISLEAEVLATGPAGRAWSP